MLDIADKLNSIGYKKHKITILGGGLYRIVIKGEVYVQLILDSFNVSKWGYVNGKLEFYVISEQDDI